MFVIRRWQGQGRGVAGKARAVGKEFDLLCGGGRALFLLHEPCFATIQQTAAMAFAQGGTFGFVRVAIPALPFRQAAVAHAADLFAPEAANVLAGIGDGEVFQLFHDAAGLLWL